MDRSRSDRGFALVAIVCLLLMSLGTDAVAFGLEPSAGESDLERWLRYLLDAGMIDDMVVEPPAAEQVEDDRNAVLAILADYEGIDTSVDFPLLLQVVLSVQQGIIDEAEAMLTDGVAAQDLVAMLVDSKVALLDEDVDLPAVRTQLVRCADGFAATRPRLMASAALDAAEVCVQLGQADEGNGLVVRALDGLEVAPTTNWQGRLASAILAGSVAESLGKIGTLTDDDEAWSRMIRASRMASVGLADVLSDPAAPKAVMRTAVREAAGLYQHNFTVLMDEDRTWGPPATQELRRSYIEGLEKSQAALGKLGADTGWLDRLLEDARRQPVELRRGPD
jgi:hypothetical protein